MYEEWKLLYRILVGNILVGNITVEVLAAACFDGIGVIARWVRRETPDGVVWEVTAMDTESDGGMQPVTDFTDEDVPAVPPTYLIS